VIEVPYISTLRRVKSLLGFRDDVPVHHQLGQPLLPPHRGQTWVTYLALLVRALVAFPDEESTWSRRVHGVAAKLLQASAYDALITTGPPMSIHLTGRALARRFGIPWVADFRDPWLDAPYLRRTPLEPLRVRRLEGQVVRAARHVVSVYDDIVASLRQRYPGAQVTSIPNGFDTDERPLLEAWAAQRIEPRFTLVHTGRLYQGQRDPSILLHALAGLLQSGSLPRDQILVRFLGPLEESEMRLFHSFGLDDVLSLEGVVPREESLRAQAQADVLVAVLGPEPLPTKMLEYFNARRPILAVGPPSGTVSTILRTTQAGILASTVEEAASAIQRYYQEFRQGGVVYTGDDQAIAQFSHERMAARYARLLDSLVERQTLIR
jgi:hypothetical protein